MRIIHNPFETEQQGLTFLWDVSCCFLLSFCFEITKPFRALLFCRRASLKSYIKEGVSAIRMNLVKVLSRQIRKLLGCDNVCFANPYGMTLLTDLREYSHFACAWRIDAQESQGHLFPTFVLRCGLSSCHGFWVVKTRTFREL